MQVVKILTGDGRSCSAFERVRHDRHADGDELQASNGMVGLPLVDNFRSIPECACPVLVVVRHELAPWLNIATSNALCK